MKQAQTKPRKSGDAASCDASVPAVNTLLNDLACNDVYKCRRARRELVEMGDVAVPYLVDVLNHRKSWVRWESAKALGQIPGAAATQALVVALGNNNFDVRWLAAEGLIDRGREALKPLMKALIEGSDSVALREGAHHVLFDLSHGNLRELVLPVLEALEDVEPSLGVPLKARALLDRIGKR